MKFAPGSVAWLVVFDLRLSVGRVGRAIGSHGTEITARRVAIDGLLIFAFMHLVGLGVVFLARHAHATLPHQWMLLDAAIAVAWLIAFAGAVYLATALLFIRGDLDLLCSSPVPTRNVFTARAVGVGVQACAGLGLLFLPPADVAVLFGDPRWLAAYPVLLVVALSAAAAALLVVMVLVRLLGPRRARTVSLVLSAFLGVSWFIAAETPSLLGARRLHALYVSFGTSLTGTPLTEPDSLLWYPARAVQGEVLPLVLVLVAGLAFFGLVSWSLPRLFLFAMQRAADVPGATHGRAVGAAHCHARFGRIVFLKEWRLILRDPWLLTRLGRLLILVLVMALVMLHNIVRHGVHGPPGLLGDNELPAAIAAIVTLVAGMLADMLVWLALCAEDLPDLLASAPRDRWQLMRMKLQAMLLPIWVLVGCAALALAWFSLASALSAAVAVAGSTLSVGMLHLLNPVPASRTDINRRMRSAGGMPLAQRLFSVVILFGWPVVAFLFPSGHWLAGLVVFLLAGGVAVVLLGRGWSRVKWDSFAAS